MFELLIHLASPVQIVHLQILLNLISRLKPDGCPGVLERANF